MFAFVRSSTRTASDAACVGIMLGAMACAAPLHAQTATPTRLDSVTIVASRAQPGTAGRSVDVITRDDIARSSAHNLAELLGARLSVDAFTRSPAQADIAIRGSTAEQVLILVNGVRMSDAQSAHYATDLGVPLSDVERIEILRGVGSALYGPNAIGGVINIVTRDATSRSATTQANAYTGSFGTVGIGGYSSALIGATALDGAVQFDRSDGHRPDTDYRIMQTRLSANQPVAGGALDADMSVGVRDFGASNFYSPYNSSERTGTATGGARWHGPVGAWTLSTSTHTRLHTDRFTLVRDNPALYENRHRSWQTGADATVRTDVGDDASLAIGADAEHDQLSSARLGGRREWRAAAFVEQAVRLGPHVQLIAGARDDHASTYGDFFSPSLAASVRASSELTLRASGARGFRAPTWTERYYVDPSNIGDPALRPERFWNAEAGASYVPAATRAIALTWDVATFIRSADNLIDWVRPSAQSTAPWRIANVGTATFRGIESSVSASPIDGVTVGVRGSGIAFSDGAAAGLAGKYALQPITRQMTATTSVPLFAGRLNLDVVRAKRATQTGYTTGNARVTWPVERVSLVVDATNIANAAWLDASGALSQGRALFVGVQWR